MVIEPALLVMRIVACGAADLADEVLQLVRQPVVSLGPKGFPQIKQPYMQILQWKGGKMNAVPAGDKKDGWVLGY